MSVAFGLDLAGYSTGTSAFARARRLSDGSFDVTLYQQTPFARKRGGRDSLGSIAEEETRTLRECGQRGRVIVDIPIDLQGLPNRTDSYFIWELTKRPVDSAFSALPPFADRLGYPVARFLNLLRRLRAERGEPLGNWLFETYPAASLQMLRLPSEKYKRQTCCFDNGRWVGETIAEIANALRLQAAQDERLNDDNWTR